jgi:hypothetical protein
VDAHNKVTGQTDISNVCLRYYTLHVPIKKTLVLRVLPFPDQKNQCRFTKCSYITKKIQNVLLTS